MFAFLLSALGPGNIAATAILAPLGMGLAYRFAISPLLIAIVIVTGANAGAFSPLAPTGVILRGLYEPLQIGNSSLLIRVFIYSAILQSASAVLAYIIFKGFKTTTQIPSTDLQLNINRLTTKQLITLAATIILILSILFFGLSLTLVTYLGSVILLILGVADADEIVKKIPWDTILLVCGMSVLVGILDKAGGLSLATTIIAQESFTTHINAILALLTGLISAYSSSSGVVMPAFVPLVPLIIEKLGTGNPTDMLIAISVGSHMVDVSPLSTLGALCIASSLHNKKKLFNQLLFWGLSMMLLAAGLAYIFLDLL